MIFFISSANNFHKISCKYFRIDDSCRAFLQGRIQKLDHEEREKVTRKKWRLQNGGCRALAAFEVEVKVGGHEKGGAEQRNIKRRHSAEHSHRKSYNRIYQQSLISRQINRRTRWNFQIIVTLQFYQLFSAAFFPFSVFCRVEKKQNIRLLLSAELTGGKSWKEKIFSNEKKKGSSYSGYLVPNPNKILCEWILKGLILIFLRCLLPRLGYFKYNLGDTQFSFVATLI